MKSLKQIICLVTLMTMAVSSSAAIVGGYGHGGTVTSYFVYPDYGDGDVTFSLSSSIPGCTAFWLRKSDPGFKEAFSTLVMAYATKSSLEVWAYDDSLWSGSGGQYCRVHAVRPV